MLFTEMLNFDYNVKIVIVFLNLFFLKEINNYICYSF